LCVFNHSITIWEKSRPFGQARWAIWRQHMAGVGMQVLVVDPNVAFATLLNEELVRLGHAVAACGSGREALTAAQAAPPDLAVVDMAVTNPNARDLARALRTLNPAVRLMLIPLGDNHADLGDDGPAVQGLLPKPFFLPELPERLEAAMAAPLSGNGSQTAQAVADPQETGALQAAPATPLAIEPPATAVAVVDDASSGGAQRPRLSLEALDKERSRIEALMSELVSDVGGDGALLTSSGGLLISVGTLAENDVASIATAVNQGVAASAQVARALGREQLRFEQSIAGGSYLLYAISVHDAVLAVTVSGSAPLGLLRHRARGAAGRIAQLCGSV
jgi:CheY-like chemotaxis protein